MTNFRKLQNEELNRISTEAFKKAPKLPVVILLDHVRSQNNVGSVFRTSDAFRIEKIFLCGITSTPENREVHKTALGAEDAVDWEYVKDTTEAVDRLKKEGYRIFAIEQAENTTSLENFSLSPVRLGTNPFLYPLALIIVVSFKTNGSLYTGAFSSGSDPSSV